MDKQFDRQGIMIECSQVDISVDRQINKQVDHEVDRQTDRQIVRLNLIDIQTH